MSAKFHIAMYCSLAVYSARKEFYAKALGAPLLNDGEINETQEDHEFFGSVWDCESVTLFPLLKDPALTRLEEKQAKVDGVKITRFALLQKLDLTAVEEKLAHIGFLFDSEAEFEAALQKRGIDPQSAKPNSNGIRQKFVEDAQGLEWEFTFVPRGYDG